jgi:nucleotide-binding universal stress UspA family protein
MDSLFRKVMIPTDFSDYSLKTVECGAELRDIGVEEVVLFHAGTYDPFLLSLARMSVEEYVEKIGVEASKKLDEQAEILRNRGISVKTLFSATSRDPAEKILEIAGEENVDLILMGSRGLGWLKGKLLGGVSESVVRKSRIPVLITKFSVVKEAGEYYCQITFERLFDRVIVALDTSEVRREVVEFLKRVIAGGEVVLMHIVEGKSSADIEADINSATEKLEGIKSRVGGGRIIIKWGNAVKEILSESEDASLIVIMATGKNGSSELGKTADAILRHSKIPVLVFK